MVYSSEAIVLKSNPYGEADLIVTYLTKEFGIVDLFAKSPRKIKSRFGSSLEPLTYSRISFLGRPEKMQRIIQSDIIESFHAIRENFKIFLRLASVINHITELFPKKYTLAEFFDLFLQTLRKISKSQKSENYILFLIINALKLSGYLPDLCSCGICKKSLNGDVYYLKGFILCRDCFITEGLDKMDQSNNSKYSIPAGSIRLIMTLISWKIEQIERIIIDQRLFNQVEYFVSRHLAEVIKA